MLRVWVVTGCSAGLGKEICLSALARGDKVIATCRGNAQVRLTDLIARGADALSLDVTAPLEDIQAFARKAISIYGQVDVLCNSAGYLQQGGVEELGAEQTSKQFTTSVFGPLNITRTFLPHMRERRKGIVAMIGSAVADMPLPGCGIYTSAKAALAALTQTLAAEVAAFNIQAICIEPGEYRTEVFAAPVTCVTPIPEYEPVLSPVLSRLGPDFKQPGDPHKGAERIVDMLTGTGLAEGRKLPFRISLGDDAYKWSIDLRDGRNSEAKEWKEWSTGTNVDGEDK